MADHKKHNGISPIIAAVTGVVVGAGIAVAGAVALNDEKNREKVKEALTNAKDKTISYVEDVQKQTKDKMKEITDIS